MITITYPKAEKEIAERLLTSACPASREIECIERCSECKAEHYRLIEEVDEEDEP